MNVPSIFIKWPEWRHDRTDEQLKRVRENAIKDMEAHGFHTPEEFTCDTCDVKNFCSLAFDIYNTNGECLLEH